MEHWRQVMRMAPITFVDRDTNAEAVAKNREIFLKIQEKEANTFTQFMNLDGARNYAGLLFIMAPIKVDLPNLVTLRDVCDFVDALMTEVAALAAPPVPTVLNFFERFEAMKVTYALFKHYVAMYRLDHVL